MSKLYLCATPIGNLEDITLRVIRALKEASCVYAEDTRHTLTLLNHLGIKARLISCHEHNEAQRAEEIVAKVKAGEDVVFVSDAGMPCVSDPGERLVAACIAAGAEFSVLPGASASLTALALSGLPAQNACFAGFLPREGKPRRERIAALSRCPGSVIIYESPLRLAAACKELSELWGERPAALCRELTKLHEEVVRDTLLGLYQRYAEQPPKGECVLVVGGAEEKAAGEEELKSMLIKLLAQGQSAKDAAKQASALLDVPKSLAYKLAVEIKEQ